MNFERGHYVYVLVCADGTWYTGYAVDPAQRFALHAAGKGAKYTRGRSPQSLVAVWQFSTATQALRFEHAFKKLSKIRKQALIDTRPEPSTPLLDIEVLQFLGSWRPPLPSC